MKEFGDTPSNINGLDADDVFNLSPSEIIELANFWDDVQSGQIIDPTDMADTIEVFIKGIEDPTVQADAIGSLISPECANVLEDAFDQSWSPDLSPELKDRLIDIAAETNEQERVQKMCELLIGELEKESTPDLPDFPEKFPSEMDDRRVRIARIRELTASTDSPEPKYPTSGDGDSKTPFEKISNAYGQGNDSEVRTLLEETPNLESVLREAGPESWALLIDLADDTEFGDLACKLLTEEGSDIIPILDEFAPDDSRSRNVIEWIMTGETPDFDSSLLIDEVVTQAMETSDTSSLKNLIETTTDRASLVKHVATEGDEVSPMLVEMLGDSDRRVQVFAMDTLYLQGDEAVDDLIRAKLHPNPDVKNNAEILLHTHFSGEASWEAVEMNYQYDNPFSEARFDSNGGGDIGTSEFSLDVDDLTERLSNSETHLEALSSLIQIGQPAMPALCQALIDSRRRKRERY